MEAKASKLELLRYIAKQGVEMGQTWEIREHFNYNRRYLYQKLSRLRKRGLIISLHRGKWELTELGYRRLEYDAKKAYTR